VERREFGSPLGSLRAAEGGKSGIRSSRLFGYPKLRKAIILPDELDLLERVGETGIQLTLAGGFNPRSPELARLYGNAARIENAQQWLTERADVRARHEWRMERVEWAVLIFVILGVIADFVLAFHGTFSK
jgi:hypothetical protein